MIAHLALLLSAVATVAIGRCAALPPPQTPVGARIDRFQQQNPLADITTTELAIKYVRHIRTLGNKVVTDLVGQTHKTTADHFQALQQAALSGANNVAAVDQLLPILQQESDDLQALLAQQAGEYQQLNQQGADQLQLITGASAASAGIVAATDAEASGQLVQDFRDKINPAVAQFRASLVQLQQQPGSGSVAAIVAQLDADFEQAHAEWETARWALHSDTNASVNGWLALV